MTIGGLGILLLIIGFVWSNIKCIQDLYNNEDPQPLYGSIAISGWIFLIISGFTYALMQVDWTYKLF